MKRWIRASENPELTLEHAPAGIEIDGFFSEERSSVQGYNYNIRGGVKEEDEEEYSSGVLPEPVYYVLNGAHQPHP